MQTISPPSATATAVADAPEIFVTSGDAVAYVYMNVGLDLTKDQDAIPYVYMNVDEDTPDPVIWYVVPTSGDQGDNFKIVGRGFGISEDDFQDSKVNFGDLEPSVVSWQRVAETLDEDPDPDRKIDQGNDDVNVEREEIEVTVPDDAPYGETDVTVEHNEP